MCALSAISKLWTFPLFPLFFFHFDTDVVVVVVDFFLSFGHTAWLVCVSKCKRVSDTYLFHTALNGKRHIIEYYLNINYFDYVSLWERKIGIWYFCRVRAWALARCRCIPSTDGNSKIANVNAVFYGICVWICLFSSLYFSAVLFFLSMGKIWNANNERSLVKVRKSIVEEKRPLQNGWKLRFQKKKKTHTHLITLWIALYSKVHQDSKLSWVGWLFLKCFFFFFKQMGSMQSTTRK